MFVLTPAHQAYAWGSTEAIQQFAGYGASGEPLAEIWFGAHPAGRATLPDGRALADYIAEDPARVLGEQVAADFDGQLPFLVKLLAPGQAVSLQVHTERRARRGGVRSRGEDAPRRAEVRRREPQARDDLRPH